MAPSSEIEKTTKEYNKTQKVTNIPNMISQLEPSLPQEILLVSKMPTYVFLLYVAGPSVNPERLIPRKKGI